MILRPLCTSGDLGKAIAFAKRRYPAFAEGVRPFIHELAYRGTTDTLLCRFLIGLSPEIDTVQIILVRTSAFFQGSGGAVVGGSATVSKLLTQTITITIDEWDTWVPPVGDTPFIATESTLNAIGVTGTLAGTGGGSGNPVVLSSSDTSVATVSGSTITIVGYGSVRFALNQAGGGDYAAAPQLLSGEHIFPRVNNIQGSGGAIVGGSARISKGNFHQGSGGAVAGGSATVTTLLTQSITIITDEWDTVGVEDTPFVHGANHGTAPNVLAINDTGTLEGTGGGSGNPVVLSSSNTAVATVSGFVITIVGYGRVRFFLDQAGGAGYAPAAQLVGGEHTIPAVNTFYASGGAIVGGAARVLKGKYHQGSGGAVVGGSARVGRSASFVGSGGAIVGGSAQVSKGKYHQGSGGVIGGGSAQISKGSYHQGSGGAIAGGSARIGRTIIFIGSGGAIAGGTARISKGKYHQGLGGVIAGGSARVQTIQTVFFQGSGGAVVGGSALISKGKYHQGRGGVIAGGSATITVESVLKPLAMQNITLTFPYKDLDTGYVTLYFNGTGTAKRGGVLTYTILGDTENLHFVAGVGSNGLPNYKMYKFDHYWLGNDTFSYKVTETTGDGVAVDSDVATVLVNAASPAAMAYTVGEVSPTLAKFTWTGGAYRFTFSLIGLYTGVTLLEPYVDSGEKFCIIQKAAGATSTSGYVKVTDHYGYNFNVPMSALGVAAASPVLICSFAIGTTSLNVGATTPITNISLDNRVSNGYVMFSSNAAIARVESNNTLVRGMNNGSCQIILKQFGIAGQYIDGRHEKTVTVGPVQPTPPVPGTGGWHIVREWSCGVWQTPYLYSPYNVTASPNGQYRLAWAVVREEYRGQSGVETTNHDPRTFATYLGVNMAFVYSNYFWGYSYSEENPESNGWIHIRYWEKFG
jgi:hypothetical protein